MPVEDRVAPTSHRHYARLSSIARWLGFPLDGKRFGRALCEVGVRDTKNRPTADAVQRHIVKRGQNGVTWLFDVDAVSAKVMGSCSSRVAAECEEMAAELVAVDRIFTEQLDGAELAVLGDRWEAVMQRMRPYHVPRLNGILRRDGIEFRFGADCIVILPTRGIWDED